MAPSLYEWQGIIIRFYSNDHEPVHVHCVYNEYESICEFQIANGKVVALQWREVEGANPLPAKQQKLALRLIKKYSSDIVNSWIDFFVLNKSVKFKRIRSKTL